MDKLEEQYCESNYKEESKSMKGFSTFGAGRVRYMFWYMSWERG